MHPTPLSKEPPSRLVWLFKAAERSSERRPGDLLPIACQLLSFASDGLVMARGCTRIALEFEGDRTHAVVRIAAMVDSQGEFILDMDRVQKWKPDDDGAESEGPGSSSRLRQWSRQSRGRLPRPNLQKLCAGHRKSERINLAASPQNAYEIVGKITETRASN